MSALLVSITKLRRLVDERDTALATLGALREGLLYVTDGRVVDVNERFCEMAGVDRGALVGRRPSELFHIVGEHECGPYGPFGPAGRKRDALLLRGNDDHLLVSLSRGALPKRGEQRRFVTTVRDVTEREAIRQEIEGERDISRAALNAIREPWAMVRSGSLIDCNDVFCTMVGQSRETLLRPTSQLPFWPSARADEAAARRAFLAEGGVWTATFIRAGSQPFPVSGSTQAARRPDGTVIGLISTLRDLSEERRREAELIDAAERDGLTGLLNARAIRRHLDTALDDAAGSPVGLVLMDIDHFKAINDRFGHPVGDSVLYEFADRLRRHTSPGDVVGRFGGEEFGVILPGASTEAALAAANRLLQAIQQEPFAAAGTVTASAGVCGSDVGADARTLYTTADAALYSAKRAGRARAHGPRGQCDPDQRASA